MITGNIVEIMSLGIGLSGLWFGLYQYRRSQQWKANEYAVSQQRRLEEDEMLSLSCVFLNWSKRTVLLPKDYQTLVGSKSFVHTWSVLKHALQPENDNSDFMMEEVLYRDCFDRFFSYLEEIESMLKLNLVSSEHVDGFAYWLEQIAHPRFSDTNHFEQFLTTYGYTGVYELLCRFELAENISGKWVVK